ncbi:hypothetical protein EDD15DRAFT_1018881 [Pisolithus albus]|nr:hypothetical protein EDD15DRAFT_1018881 [Pisolithus albus]
MLSFCKTHSKVGYHSVRGPSLCTITTTRIETISSRNKPKPDCGICIKVVTQVTLRIIEWSLTLFYSPLSLNQFVQPCRTNSRCAEGLPSQTETDVGGVPLPDLIRMAVLLPQQIDATEIKESLQRDGTVCSGDSRCNESPTSERSNFNCRDVYLLLMDKKSIDVHGGKKTHWN